MKRVLFSDRVRAETARRGTSLLRRFGSQAGFDMLAWVVAVFVAIGLRYEDAGTGISWLTVAVLCLALAFVQLVAGATFWLYRGRFSYGSFEEVRALLYTVIAVAVICGVPLAVIGIQVGLARSIVFGALPFAFVFMGKRKSPPLSPKCR